MINLKFILIVALEPINLSEEELVLAEKDRRSPTQKLGKGSQDLLPRRVCHVYQLKDIQLLQDGAMTSIMWLLVILSFFSSVSI